VAALTMLLRGLALLAMLLFIGDIAPMRSLT
jgi:hypothetical protein